MVTKNRISTKTKSRYKNSMRNVVKGLSRRICVHKEPVKNACPNCYYDKLTSKSTGKCKWTVAEAAQLQADYAITNPGVTRYKYFSVGRCPICRGKGQLEIPRRRFVDCLIIWNPKGGGENEDVFTAAGLEGRTIIELKTHPKHYNLFLTCVKIVVDGVECNLYKPPIVRGLGNQSILIVTAVTSNKPKKNSGEAVRDFD